MPSPRENLQNLEKVGKFKAEPPDQAEFDGLVKQARQTLPDAGNPGNSAVSRFNLAYDASHFLALAALRWHGYRSDNRQINFQSLVHTVGFAPVKWRILDNCHKKRNVAQYDGDFSPDEELISELIAVTKELQAAVAALGPVGG